MAMGFPDIMIVSLLYTNRMLIGYHSEAVYFQFNKWIDEFCQLLDCTCRLVNSGTVTIQFQVGHEMPQTWSSMENEDGLLGLVKLSRAGSVYGIKLQPVGDCIEASEQICRCNSTLQFSRIGVGVCIEFATSSRRIWSKNWKWTCWEFIQSSWLQNWKLGHDCWRLSSLHTAPHNSTQHVQFSFFLLNASAVIVS